jgi:uncharacterized protein YqiB (DUF1249 family)
LSIKIVNLKNNKVKIKVQQFKQKSLYKPDLDELISQCEINYCLIVKLFPSLLEQKCEKLSDIRCHIEKQELACSQPILSLKIIETVRYTTTLQVEFKAPSNIVKRNLVLIVRLYHDAKMLEVMEGISATQLSAIRAVQDKNHYPVKLVDEKRQLNAFLGESLKYCLDINCNNIEHSERNGCQ